MRTVEAERFGNKCVLVVAVIITKGEAVYFDPFESNVDKHFSEVSREVLDKIWKSEHNMTYQKHKQKIDKRDVQNLSLSEIKKKIKGRLLGDINEQFKERGINTLKDFAGEANGTDFVIGWESIKESVKEKYQTPDKPTEELKDIPPEPSPEDPKFKPDFGILDYIVPSSRKNKEKEASKKFRERYREWDRKTKVIKKYNDRKLNIWRQKKSEYESTKREIIEKVINKREKYEEGDEATVEKVVAAKIEKTDYPCYLSFEEIKEIFNTSINTSFERESKNLVLSYRLPNINDIPSRRRIEYVEKVDIIKSVCISDSKVKNLYKNIPYNIALRIIKQIFEFDFSSGQVIESVVFNGFTSHIEEETGIEEAICKVSVKCSRGDIREMDLSEADPQAAFEHLGGRSASSMCDASSVTPIMQIDQIDVEDSESTAAGSGSDDSEGVKNLAEMDREEFEHLIVDLFEKEFAEEGGELKVTQASQDGGIDAIAHDPDPLRGGKFVIQAKRSTQTVGASAVQDLHGTVGSEDADKGVLVTTSDFSPSAHNFAKDKLIQLLNGDDLLRLLDRHGYDARIDLDPAGQ